MAKNRNYHHLIPQVYMRAWKHGKSSIYVVESGKNDLGKETKTSTFGGINNYHSIKAGMLFASPDDCNEFFKPLQNYNLLISGRKIKDPVSLNMNFLNFDDWIINDSNGVKVTRKVKNSLKASILSIVKKDIEKGWDKYYENHWNAIIDKINSVIKEKLEDENIVLPHWMHLTKIGEEIREELIKFMISIEWRTKRYHPELQKMFDQSLRRKNFDFKSIVIPKGEMLYPFLTTLYDEYAHGIMLKYYREFLEGKGPIMEEVQEFIKESGFAFHLAPDDGEFITSDNPVCRFINDNGNVEYFFPLNPKVACTLYPKGHKDYFLLNPCDKDELVEFNNLVKESCKEGYIIRKQNRELYFGKK
ncbi:hypothetical protein BK784_21210 [Bacillus thuringiensis serovar medellin]|uniref:DUF4238 domain-containing protein n=1 Tax=Bacillus thuringiensis subsp. medellin TaxID=79672 RepID=A0A9X6MXG5_BACTV|nr:DUF4238 domain-containing protein [Bacillus thuringiensis]OUB94139.1 hypothetical protein BK784_21210 [Bacillus thuringiensis serovar medellin]